VAGLDCSPRDACPLARAVWACLGLLEYSPKSRLVCVVEGA
jgi:hypothetical protein